MAQSLQRYGVRKDILRIVPHGVDLERFRQWKSPEERRSLRNKLRIPADAVVVLFVGHLTARKGADYMLGAFELLAESVTRALLVYAGGRWEFDARSKQFADELTASISASPYADRILLVGAVQNIAEYFRAADIFVFPSEREGMPNAVLEAMATGLPCVLTPFVGLSDEFGSPGVEYKLVERNIDSMAEGIMELIQNDAERSALGQAARRQVERHIGLERTLDQIADILTGLPRGPVEGSSE